MPTITIPPLSGAECGDIAITAAEGGIGYWSTILSYDYERWGHDESMPAEIADDFVFYTIEHEIIGETPEWMADPANEGATHTSTDITPELLNRGYNLAVEGDLIRKDLREQMLDPNERAGMDADAADCIVQLGVFGEIVFG